MKYGSKVIRPLLKTHRFEIRQFILFWKLPIYSDQSNQKTYFLRNKIRKQLMPILRIYFNPKIDNVLLNFIDIKKCEQLYFQNLLKYLINSQTCQSYKKSSISLFFLVEKGYPSQLKDHARYWLGLAPYAPYQSSSVCQKQRQLLGLGVRSGIYAKIYRNLRFLSSYAIYFCGPYNLVALHLYTLPLCLHSLLARSIRVRCKAKRFTPCASLLNLWPVPALGAGKANGCVLLCYTCGLCLHLVLERPIDVCSEGARPIGVWSLVTPVGYACTSCWKGPQVYASKQDLWSRVCAFSYPLPLCPKETRGTGVLQAHGMEIAKKQETGARNDAPIVLNTKCKFCLLPFLVQKKVTTSISNKNAKLQTLVTLLVQSRYWHLVPVGTSYKQNKSNLNYYNQNFSLNLFLLPCDLSFDFSHVPTEGKEMRRSLNAPSFPERSPGLLQKSTHRLAESHRGNQEGYKKIKKKYTCSGFYMNSIRKNDIFYKLIHSSDIILLIKNYPQVFQRYILKQFLKKYNQIETILVANPINSKSQIKSLTEQIIASSINKKFSEREKKLFLNIVLKLTC